MILLGLSRVLFTHSLPLVAAEQCYNKLLRDLRALILTITSESKKEEAYKMLIKLIEDYNVKLLSTKVYWENSDEREKYKKFWAKYSNASSPEEKEILALKRELGQIDNLSTKNKELRKYYKSKLIELGAMKTFKISCVTGKSARYFKI